MASDMGLGKTLQVYWWLKENPTIRPAVVVCPAGLRDHWAHEGWTHTRTKTTVLTGNHPPRGYRQDWEDVVIIGYGTLEGWMPLLKSFHPRCIILDEAHYAKERSAKRTKWVRKLCDGVPHVIAVSGTPLTNRPAELWPVLNILRPDLFPSFTVYANEYCAPTWTHWGWQYKGARNLKKLHRMLSKHLMIRQRKEDVLQDLPPLRRHVVLLTLDDGAKEEYDRAEKHFISWLKDLSPRRAKRALKSEALVKVGYLVRLAATLKIPKVVSWIEDYLEDTDDKLAIYGVQRTALEHLHELWKSSVLIYGDTPAKKRHGIKDTFNHDPRVRLLFGNVQAAGTGISLKCPTVAFAELGWTPGEHAQVEKRIHGIGRGIEGVTGSIYYLIASGTIEERLCSILQKKQAVLDQTLDGRGRVDSLNVHDLLIQSYEQEPK